MEKQKKPSLKHQKLISRARDVFPGCTNNAVSPKFGQEFIVERGEGAYLFDIDGRSFLDFTLGSGPLVLGHAHPRMVKTVKQAAEIGTHHFAPHVRAVELAERICEYVPCAEMVRFTASGNEATYNAIRLARAVTGRDGIIKFDGAFHGHHDLVAWSFERSNTDFPRPFPQSAGVQKGVEGDVVVMPFNDLESVEQIVRESPERYAAIICEPFQRMVAPDEGFLEGLRSLCDETGTILIFDEIVTGFRLAIGGAQEFYGVTPDLAAIGKALSAGLPFAALIGKKKLLEHLDPASRKEQFSFHCGTLNAYLLGVEAAHTCLDILINDEGINYLGEIGSYARKCLTQVFSGTEYEVKIVGEGPLFHVYFTNGPIRNNADVAKCDWVVSDRLHELLFESGIYKPSVKGYLSIVHQREHIDQLCETISQALRIL